MREAVIVSAARTPIGRAYRGAFNNLEGPTLAAHAITAAVARAGIEPAEVDDVIMGCAMPQGTTGYNIGRLAALAAGLPVEVSGMTMDRQCSSGLMAVATAAKQVIVDKAPVVVAGGVESISLVQNEHHNLHRSSDPRLLKTHPDAYMPMLKTAEVVAERYAISREQQDEYSLQSQQRTAAAQEAGRLDAEIVPVTATKALEDRSPPVTPASYRMEPPPQSLWRPPPRRNATSNRSAITGEWRSPGCRPTRWASVPCMPSPSCSIEPGWTWATSGSGS